MNDWRVRTAFEDAHVTVLVVESSQFAPTTSPSACHLVASLEPAAIVVSRDDDIQAFDATGIELDAASLGARFDGVAQAIQDALD